MRISYWTKSVRKPHECYPPRRVKYKYWTGSQWECSCGQVWEVARVIEGFDREYIWERTDG